MAHLVIDLEMNQPSRKIIQIGAVIGDLESGVIIKTLRLFVNPLEPLNPRISKLTGIEASQLKSPLIETVFSLETFIKQNQIENEPLIWGTSDITELRKQILEGDPNRDVGFLGKSWIDVRSLFFLAARRRGLPEKVNLLSAMKSCGILFSGRPHDALSDARNTFIFAYHLLKKA